MTATKFEYIIVYLYILQIKKVKQSHSRHKLWAGADPGFLAVIPAVSCHYFLPGPHLPSQMQAITAQKPVIKLYCLVTEAYRCK